MIMASMFLCLAIAIYIYIYVCKRVETYFNYYTRNIAYSIIVQLFPFMMGIINGNNKNLVVSEVILFKLDTFPTSRYWNHPTTFITKKTYGELSLYRNEGIHDDFDLFLRIRKAKKIIIKNVVLVNFRMGGISNNKSFSRCKKRCLDRYCCYINNGYSKLSIVECLGIEVAKYLLG